MERTKALYLNAGAVNTYQKAIEKVCEILKETERIQSSLVRFSIQTHCLDLVLELEKLRNQNIH
ncbi:MAG: hypothetical protein D6780_01600 [Candidatus Dadabacteria bacterium]|nr:MAG: hypothetical protein D6780_01600 [Candidatus Dadabacteria bacterium]